MATRYCRNCGTTAVPEFGYPIGRDLQTTWQISDKVAALFNLREGASCQHCGASVRAQGLARAILESKYGFGQTSLRDWVTAANKHGLKVCELNSCQKLHDTLQGLKHLTYSEYGTKTQQDIEALTYKDNSFDLVLHSETIEHVDNPRQALDECRRVLKPDGLVLFTTPVLWSRTSRRRAEKQGSKTVKLLPASYHGYVTDDYLVFHEFGKDINSLTGAGVALADWRLQNYVFVSGKNPTKIGGMYTFKYQFLEFMATHRKAKSL